MVDMITDEQPQAGKRRRGLITAATLLTLFAFSLAGASCMSRMGGFETGLQDNRLRSGTSAPNWVSSDLEESNKHHVEPFHFDGDSAVAWERLREAVQACGGRISSDEAPYLHAVFVTRLFRFRDDFEARLDAETGVIHVRSGSRLGQHDTGTNRRRIERIRNAFNQLSGPESSVNK